MIDTFQCPKCHVRYASRYQSDMCMEDHRDKRHTFILTGVMMGFMFVGIWIMLGVLT